jgi:hypothetical protein
MILRPFFTQPYHEFLIARNAKLKEEIAHLSVLKKHQLIDG